MILTARHCASVMGILMLAPLGLAQLDDSCSVTILNRSAQADSAGIWLVTNIPTGFGPVRAHAVCTKNGQTLFGKHPQRMLAPSPRCRP